MYSPILKGKEGEFAALEDLAADVKEGIVPLIQIPDVSYDYINERPAKTIDAHAEAIATRLQVAWQDRFYLDATRFEETDADRLAAVRSFLLPTRTFNAMIIPVLDRSSSPELQGLVKAARSNAPADFCIRLALSDFGDDYDLGEELARLRAGAAADVDLLIDLGDLGVDDGRSMLLARSVLSAIPTPENWRRVILAAASFPPDLSAVDAETASVLPRREWLLWDRLQRRRERLPALLAERLVFSDYAISNPVQRELDPRTMRMSASIRYTTNDSWLVLKGRNVRQFGFEQYFELSGALVGRAEYFGEAYCWGDEFLALCARREKGPGNATTWRKVGTNHHLTVTVRQLANYHPVPSSSS
jgi:hypothetical protein